MAKTVQEAWKAKGQLELELSHLVTQFERTYEMCITHVVVAGRMLGPLGSSTYISVDARLR